MAISWTSSAGWRAKLADGRLVELLDPLAPAITRSMPIFGNPSPYPPNGSLVPVRMAEGVRRAFWIRDYLIEEVIPPEESAA